MSIVCVSVRVSVMNVYMFWKKKHQALGRAMTVSNRQNVRQASIILKLCLYYCGRHFLWTYTIREICSFDTFPCSCICYLEYVCVCVDVCRWISASTTNFSSGGDWATGRKRESSTCNVIYADENVTRNDDNNT